MKQNKKNSLKITISLIVFVLCVLALSSRVDFPLVLSNIKKTKAWVFVFTVSLSIIRTWLTGLRWEMLHPNKNKGMSKWSYFRLSMLSFLFNLFMPGALGGDIIRTAYVINEGKGQKVKKAISVFVDRVIGLVSILILGVIALLFTHNKISLSLWQLVVLICGLVGVFVVISNRKIIEMLWKIFLKIPWLQKIVNLLFKNWHESLEFYKHNLRSVFGSLALCVPIHMISFFIYFMFAKSIGMHITFFEMMFAVAIMWLITAVPISIGGMGVRELSLVWLLGMFGILPEQAVSLSVLGYVNSLIKSVFALPLLFDFRNIKEEKV